MLITTGVVCRFSQIIPFTCQIWSEIGKGYLDGSMEKSSIRKEHYESGE